MKEEGAEPSEEGKSDVVSIRRQPRRCGAHRKSFEEENVYIPQAALDWWGRVHWSLIHPVPCGISIDMEL